MEMEVLKGIYKSFLLCYNAAGVYKWPNICYNMYTLIVYVRTSFYRISEGAHFKFFEKMSSPLPPWASIPVPKIKESPLRV